MLILSFKNNSKDKEAYFESEDDSFYDSDNNPIKTEIFFPARDLTKLEWFFNAEILPGETRKGFAVFRVKRKANYELRLTPTSYVNDAKDLVLNINSSKYSDNSEELIKLSKTYIDNVFLGRHTETKLDNNVAASRSAFKKTLSENLSDSVSYKYRPTAAETKTPINALIAANAKRGEVEYSILENFPDYALINVKVRAIDFNYIDMTEIMTDWTEKNYQKYQSKGKNTTEINDKLNQDAVKFLMNQLPASIEQTPVTSPLFMKDGYEMALTKDSSGKWSVDETDNLENDAFYDLRTAFMGGLEGY
ncbi:MAG: hypothetical protein LBV19_02285 [Streptococcaceae bacterium]|jgi:hypothetical protein|nr:hypothetical protein [Streptococcaceae bacterium]